MTGFNETDAIARYQALAQVEIKNRQKADDQRLARALIVADAKANLKPSLFKAFLVKIECADSTSRELLKIAKAGDPAEVRRATALRVAEHRARKAAAVTSKCNITDAQVVAYNDTYKETGSVAAATLAAIKAADTPSITPAEGVVLAASHGVVMTEPEVAECLKLADMPKDEFEAHVASITPEPESPTLIDDDHPAPKYTKLAAADVWALIQPVLDLEKRYPLTVKHMDKTGYGFEIVGGTVELYDALDKAASRLTDFKHWLGEDDRSVLDAIEARYEAKRNLRKAKEADARKLYKATTGKGWGGGRVAELFRWYDEHNKKAKDKGRAVKARPGSDVS